MTEDALIKILDDIDHKLRNRTYVDKKQVVGRLSGQVIDLPEVTSQRYSGEEISDMITRKGKVVSSLHQSGAIDDKEYEKFLLSEDLMFTPKINFNIKK